MDIILKEDHKVTQFQVYPQPDNFVAGNEYQTKVHHEKDIEGDSTLIVQVQAMQSVDTQPLCVITTLSVYELSIPKEEIVNLENWKPLVIRSIVECNNLYKEQVIGTYLEKTDIPAPME